MALMCDCRNFYPELVNLSEEILAEGDGSRHWNGFEQFLKKWIKNDIHDIDALLNETCDSDTQFTIMCSLKICSILADKLNEFRRRDIALSTLLVDLRTIFHYISCARFMVSYVWNFDSDTCFSRERETIRVLSALRINSCLRHGDCDWNSDFMKFLLDYGLIYRLSNDSSFLWEELRLNLRIGILEMCKDDRPNIDLDHTESEVMKLIKGIFVTNANGEIHKRMMLAVWAVRGIQLSVRHNMKQISEQYINSLRMYFTATRDAFLSVFEVRSVLYACLSVINNLNLFEMYCEEFDKLMPECPAKLEPRTLAHLARYQIRENLKMKNLPLPSAMDKLFFPKLFLPISLKSFLLGEATDISKKKCSVSSKKSVTQSKLTLLFSELSTS